MTAQITMYVPAGEEVIVINGTPPIDQSAQVATLQAEVQTLTTAVTDLTTANGVLQGKIDAARAAAQAAKDADAANVEGQAVLDALA